MVGAFKLASMVQLWQTIGMDNSSQQAEVAAFLKSMRRAVGVVVIHQDKTEGRSIHRSLVGED